MMKLTAIFEVIRVKQEIRETKERYENYVIRSPFDAQDLAATYIAGEDREVFLVRKNSILIPPFTL